MINWIKFVILEFGNEQQWQSNFKEKDEGNKMWNRERKTSSRKRTEGESEIIEEKKVNCIFIISSWI